MIQNFIQSMMKNTNFILISDVLQEAKDLARKNKQIILSLVSVSREKRNSIPGPVLSAPSHTSYTDDVEPQRDQDDEICRLTGRLQVCQRFAGVQLDGSPPVS